MKVFITWSGERSRRIATALREWVPAVIQAADPWMSAHDIRGGSRWREEIGERLAVSSVGIIVLTPENVQAPWVLFEAGALSTAVPHAAVIPYLFDLQPPGLPDPIAQFQAVTATRDGTLELVRAINAAAGDERLKEASVDRVFRQWWRELQSRLQQASGPLTESRSQSEAHPAVSLDLEEQLSAVRTELASQAAAMRTVLEAVVSRAPDRSTEPNPYRNFEGIWRSDEDSVYFAAVLDGKLGVIYQRSGWERPTGEFYDFLPFRGLLLGRFAWFNGDAKGYVSLSSDHPGSVEGSWWIGELDAGESASDALAAAARNGVHFSWTLLPKHAAPDWAQRAASEPGEFEREIERWRNDPEYRDARRHLGAKRRTDLLADISFSPRNGLLGERPGDDSEAREA